MAAEFEVHRASTPPSRGLLVLGGVVVEGMVHTGMIARGTDPSGTDFVARVHSVEFLERVEGEADSSEPALTFHVRDANRLERFAELDWEGVRLSLGFGGG